MTAIEWRDLNDRSHGKLNRGNRGYYPTPGSGKSNKVVAAGGSRKRNFMNDVAYARSSKNFENLQNLNKIASLLAAQ